MDGVYDGLVFCRCFVDVVSQPENRVEPGSFFQLVTGHGGQLFIGAGFDESGMQLHIQGRVNVGDTRALFMRVVVS